MRFEPTQQERMSLLRAVSLGSPSGLQSALTGRPVAVKGKARLYVRDWGAKLTVGCVAMQYSVPGAYRKARGVFNLSFPHWRRSPEWLRAHGAD